MKKRQLIELITIFLLSLLFIVFTFEPTNDNIWNYGTIYSIANGKIPYRDFNLITPPLFYYIGVLFQLLFNNFISLYIYGATITTCIYYFLKKYNPKSFYIPFMLLLIVQTLPNYNLLCLLLLYILLIAKEKENDYLIGFILGLVVVTKQSVGLAFLIPTIILLIVKPKKSLKRLIGLSLPIGVLLIYLIVTKSFISFIDYCFLGIIDFGSDNGYHVFSTMLVVITAICYLIYRYFKTKDTNIFYLIAIYIISIPIMDSHHVLISIIPTLNYFFNTLKLNKKILATVFTICSSIILSINVYQLFYTDIYTYPNQTQAYRYNKLANKTADEIVKLTNIMKVNEGYHFFINSGGYILKIEAGLPITKYDLLLTSNMGYHGTKRMITNMHEICITEKCYFWVNQSDYETDEYNQYDNTLHEYVINNYQPYIKEYGLTIYKN